MRDRTTSSVAAVPTFRITSASAGLMSSHSSSSFMRGSMQVRIAIFGAGLFASEGSWCLAVLGFTEIACSIKLIFILLSRVVNNNASCYVVCANPTAVCCQSSRDNQALVVKLTYSLSQRLLITTIRRRYRPVLSSLPQWLGGKNSAFYQGTSSAGMRFPHRHAASFSGRETVPLGLGGFRNRPLVDSFSNSGFKHEVQSGFPFEVRNDIQQGST